MKPTTRYVLSATGLVGFLLIWEGIGRSGWMEPYLLPPPSTIPPALISEIREGFWPAVLWARLRPSTIGFFIGPFRSGTSGGVGVSYGEACRACGA